MQTRRNFLAATAVLAGTPWESLLTKMFGIANGTLSPVRGNVSVYTERGGTIGVLLNKEGLAIVDTQFQEQAQHLLTQLREKTDRKVDLLINTHHHGDHSSGNIVFKDVVKQVLAHSNSKANQERVAKERKTEAQQLYPDTVYETEWKGKVGDETIALKYFGRGHTNGDSVIHFEQANVAHMGDLMFNRRFPAIDRSAGALIANWAELLGKVVKHYEKDTLYIFGHAAEGKPITGDAKDLLAFQAYLDGLLKVVRAKIKAGVSADDLVKQVTSIPEAPEWKGDGIERSLRTAYEEIKGEK